MGRSFPAFLLAVSLLLGTARAHGRNGDDSWIEVRSSHFDVLTDGGAGSGRDLAIQFEKLRSVLAQLLPAQPVRQPVPLQIIAFKNSGEISRYSRLYADKPIKSTGFCLRSEDRDYIVLDLAELNRENVIHEYAHLLLAAGPADLPPWFNEGFAGLYSTVHIDGEQAAVGRPPQSAQDVLRNNSLMPVTALFSVDQDSAVYNEDSDPRSMFYAESWLVVHYLWEHNQMDQAQQYAQLIRHQVPVAEAIRRAFHLDPAQFDALLQKYSHSGISSVRVTIHRELEREPLSVKALSALDVKVALAGLHSHQPDYQGQAIEELQDVLRQDPVNAAANRDLGYIYYQRHDSDAALPYLQKAVEENPGDWRVHYFFARLSAEKNDDKLAPQIEKDARRIVEINPELADGYGLLGFALMVERRNAEAITAYRQALALKPSSEIYQLNLAELYSLEGRLDEAKPLFLSLQNSANLAISTAAHSHLQLMASHGQTEP